MKENKNYDLIFLGEERYPYLLKEISDPPKYLYYEGNYDAYKWDNFVSVVGTRRPSYYGKNVASRIGRLFAQAGKGVVSGIAYGIDRISQESCIKAGGRSVSVLGEGIDAWKKHNEALYHRFGNTNHLLISEYHPDFTAKKYTFPERNRIIAGLTSKTIVVEAAIRSGALITGNMAFDFDREVYAVPHNINEEMGRGCNKLILDNKAIILNEIESIIKDSISKNQYSFELYDEITRSILELLSRRGLLSEEEILKTLGENNDNVKASLTSLEVKGILSRSIDGRYNFIFK